MSDYIENQEYSMQLAAPGDDPFAYDWARLQEEVDGAASSLFGDITLASLQEPMDVDNVDLSGLHRVLENGPWRDFFGWSAHGQSMQAQPDGRCGPSLPYQSPPSNSITRTHETCGVRSISSQHIESEGSEQQSDCPVLMTRKYVCIVDGCKSKPFNRSAELRRHSLKHDKVRSYPCHAIGCKFVGNKAFTRSDKLNDHMLAGHDLDSEFICGLKDCPTKLPRDLLVIHRGETFALWKYRKCPMPKCGFKVNPLYRPLDDIQIHLAQKHSTDSRKSFARLLSSRGYDYATLDIICPLCVSSGFRCHSGFYEHALQDHLVTVIELTEAAREAAKQADETFDKVFDRAFVDVEFDGVEYDTRNLTLTPYPSFRDGNGKKLPHDPSQCRRTMLGVWPAFDDVGSDDVQYDARNLTLTGPTPSFRLNAYDKTPRHILKQYRRTMLSLWPAFSEHHVWMDIRAH